MQVIMEGQTAGHRGLLDKLLILKTAEDNRTDNFVSTKQVMLILQAFLPQHPCGQGDSPFLPCVILLGTTFASQTCSQASAVYFPVMQMWRTGPLLLAPLWTKLISGLWASNLQYTQPLLLQALLLDYYTLFTPFLYIHYPAPTHWPSRVTSPACHPRKPQPGPL